MYSFKKEKNNSSVAANIETPKKSNTLMASNQTAPIQRMLAFDAKNHFFYSDKNRPSSHLNKRALVAVITDLLQKGPKNEIEKALDQMLKQGKNPDQIADYIIQHNWLSKVEADICHKIPYASIERVVEEVCDLVYNSLGKKQKTSDPKITAFKNLVNDVNPKSNSLAKDLLESKTHAQILGNANKLLNELDEAPKNLKFGHASSNRSIGQNLDLHFDALKTGPGPIPPTPRGLSMAKNLYKSEIELNILPRTTQVVVAPHVKGSWVMTSDVPGKKSDDTGQIHTQ